MLDQSTVDVHLIDDFYFFPFTLLGVFSLFTVISRAYPLPDLEFCFPSYFLGASQRLPVKWQRAVLSHWTSQQS